MKGVGACQPCTEPSILPLALNSVRPLGSGLPLVVCLERSSNPLGATARFRGAMTIETLSSPAVTSTLLGMLYFLVTGYFATVVIMKRRPVGVALSWLLLLILLPVVGVVLFLLFGVHGLGRQRLRRSEEISPAYTAWVSAFRKDIIAQGYRPVGHHNRVHQLTLRTLRIPAIPGNCVELFSTTDSIFSALLKDIDQAVRFVHLEFYIFQSGGLMSRMVAALKKAAQRGVQCRVLLDAVGSSQFLRSTDAISLKKAGICIQAAMPVGPVRVLFERIDLRNHRKLIVIDDAIAWTGSLNMIDPALFKQRSGVGQWVDAMLRIEGWAAHVCANVFSYDWEMETGENLAMAPHREISSYLPSGSDAAVHIVPSGPGADRQLIHFVLLAAIYECQEKLTVSTPYFVPDEALVSALCSAALRGVQVTLVVPERVDSRLVYYASRSYYEDLIDAGVEIRHFCDGLLHTKCVLVDDEMVLFGTVNLDMRSVWLNLELTLVVYNATFGACIAELLDGYISKSRVVQGKVWKKRPLIQRLAENCAQLLSPLL